MEELPHLNFWDDDETEPNQEVRDSSADYLPIEARIKGEVLREVYRSPDSNYAVFRIRPENQSVGEVTLTGPLSDLLEGQEVEAEGNWENNPKHGRQFKVRTIRALLPQSKEGLIKYLSSGVLEGVGLEFAKRIVGHFGTGTIDILDHYSERLKEVPGIGKKKLEQIRASWKDNQEGREVKIYLQGLGISLAFVQRIIAAYSVESAAEYVKTNPYRLASDIDGIGFLTADRIAERLGISRNDPKRLCAGISYALEQLADRGNVCFPADLLTMDAAKLLGITQDEAEAGLKIAVQEGRVFLQQFPDFNNGRPLAYLHKLLVDEQTLAVTLRILTTTPPRHRVAQPNAVSHGKFTFNREQQQAIQHAFCHSLSIITGGPGVGKTTVISQIVSHARQSGLKMMLAAPTGRAAKRLGEATGEAAQTIHRLLKWQPKIRQFEHDVDNPLPCDLLVVDECSMLDISLAASLFQAVRPGTFLVLVGDKDQLPSVGPGTVLQDMITSGIIPVTYLTEVYRQDDKSRIITNAHLVNDGRLPDLNQVKPGELADFYWLEQDDPEKAAALITKMVSERIPAAFGFDPLRDVQVLCPMRKGQCGTISLNESLQTILNPGGDSGNQEICLGNRIFRVGDKVMQIANNYDKGIFNGEMGFVVEVDLPAKTFTVSFEQGLKQYKAEEMSQLVLSYAVTVHKSQGSEFPVVIMPLLSQHFVMLQRNLVYTGMTRARKLLIMIGSRKALAMAVRNNEPVKRMSMLRHRLVAMRRK